MAASHSLKYFEAGFMTILEYITPSRLGGAEEYFGRLVAHLRARGHRVIVVTKRDAALRAQLEATGVEVLAWKTNGKFDPKTLGRLMGVVRREKVDLIHTHLTTASWNGNLVGRLSGVPVVAHVHAADRKTWFQWAHYQVAVARGVKAHLMAQGVPSRRIPVLYYGLDLEQHDAASPLAEAKTRLGLAPDARTVGVVASLIERKGHRYLLNALKQIEASVGPSHALFAGEGPLLETLRAQAKEFGMEDRVHFLGFRADSDDIIAACDIIALPSFKEGLSIAVMEAMALRRAVIATDVAGMPELVRDRETGLLITPGDVEALAGALQTLWTQPQFAAQLAIAGRAWMEERFDQRRCLTEVEAFLSEVVAAWQQGKRVDCTDR